MTYRNLCIPGIVLLVSVLLTASGCSNSPAAPDSGSDTRFTYRDPYAWPTSSPTVQGLDTAKVSLALKETKANPFILSLLVIKNDTLVVEYYSRFQKENDYEIHSASKSFTSALLGIAIDKGIIRSAQERVLSYFPDFDTTGIDPRKRNWTLEHFLTMKSGIDWNETADHTSLYSDNVNWMYTTLKLPLKYAPGEQFLYTTPNVNLLSGIITRASGISSYDFAERYLFTPLKISVRAWLKDPQGVYAGGTGMSFTPRDLARLGQLYLHNGMIDGTQIVSRQWIQQTLVPRNSANHAWGDLPSVNYGYLWWNNYDSRDSIFMAAGFAGQFVFVIPAKNMIIVTIGDDNVTTEQASYFETVMIGILKKYFF
ncbi:MAG: serine hydrolase [Ignavibacteriales bacterium]|nr:serine hydrolase [Ignavibacteriales bacterium]